jgi:glycosyltransferase involved in cell wall biosynthesis
MNIVFLTQYYRPEVAAAASRLSDLARRLAARGHRVDVVTAVPSYPGTEVFPEYRRRAPVTEVMEGVTVHRSALYVARRRTFSRRLRSYLSFAGHAALLGRRRVRTADIVLMESPPLFLAPTGVYLARRLHARLVANISDLWPQTAVALGMVRSQLLTRWAGRLEAWMYRQASLVTAQTEGIVASIRERFPDRSVRLFPNGVACEAYAGPLDRQGVRAELGWRDDQLVLAYTGLLGHGQALSQVIDAAKLLEHVGGLHFALIGDGPCRDDLKARARDHRLPNLAFYPVQPSARMPHVHAATDAGLVTLARHKLFQDARPSKLFEVMAAARPVILAAAGESVHLVMDASGGPAGLVAEPENPSDLAAKVLMLLADREEAARMGQRGRRHAFARFDRGRIAAHVEALFVALLRDAPLPEWAA